MKRYSGFLVIFLIITMVLVAGCAKEAPNTEQSTNLPESTAADKTTDNSDVKAEYIIKYGSGVAEVTDRPDPDATWAYAFRDYVQEKSGGRIKVDFYFNNQLGGQTDLFQGVGSGAIEVAVLNGMTTENFNKNVCLFSSPGLFKSLSEANAVFDSEWAAKFFDQIRSDNGVIVAGTAATGFRNFTNDDKEIKVPADAKGLLLRVMESPVSMKMVESIGASPIPIDWGEVYTALQNGVADGQENVLSGVIANKVYEVQHYMVLDKHMVSSLWGMVSQKWLDTLPEDLQTVVLDGMRAGAEASRAMLDKYNEDALDFLRENGVKIYEPTAEEMELWQSAYRTLPYDYIRTQVEDPKYVDELFALLESLDK